MFALCDVNAFYASCETVFRPDLWGKPVVVLSNNDGCVIARNAEAKALGVKMGDPWFKQKDLFRRCGVVCFSSNYELYADMSNRVMSTLEELSPRVEIYSIEIAFKMERIGKRHIGEKRGVTAVAFKRCDMFRVMAPEDNLVAISCQGDGKSGAVRAGTDHSH